MASEPATVLVFDSGLGGTTVLEAIQKRYPGCAFLYCSDNAAFPYGIKPEAELIARVTRVLTRLERDYAPDIFVIACNTASTVALPQVRNLIAAPVVGVVPAIKPASVIAQTSHIGLLATPGTIQRHYTQSLIDEFGKHFDWVKVGSSELVELAERKMYGDSISQSALEKIVAPFASFTAEEMDSIVLACTHFPLLKAELKRALPQIRNWIDSSDAIAKRVGFWLNELGFGSRPATYETTLSRRIVFTKALGRQETLASLLEKLGIDETCILDI